jgi:hypothetical protein
MGGETRQLYKPAPNGESVEAGNDLPESEKVSRQGWLRLITTISLSKN